MSLQAETADAPCHCDLSTSPSTTLGSASTKTARGCPRQLKKSREPAILTTAHKETVGEPFGRIGGDKFGVF